MYAVIFALATYVVVMASFGVFGWGTALVAQAWGVRVFEIGIGVGPTVFQRETRWGLLRVRLLPLGSYVEMHREEDLTQRQVARLFADPNWQSRPDNRLFEIGTVKLLATLFAGPLLTLLMGIVLLFIPIAAGAPQWSHCTAEESMVRPCGVEGLAFEPQASTWAGQLQLFRDTVVEFVVRLFSLRSLAGWGGPIACFITCGYVGAVSLTGWITCCGVLVLAFAVFTLLPLPGGGGFERVLTIAQYFVGDDTPQKALHIVRLAFSVVFLLFMLPALGVDLVWLWEAWPANPA